MVHVALDSRRFGAALTARPVAPAWGRTACALTFAHARVGAHGSSVRITFAYSTKHTYLRKWPPLDRIAPAHKLLRSDFVLLAHHLTTTLSLAAHETTMLQQERRPRPRTTSARAVVI